MKRKGIVQHFTIYLSSLSAFSALAYSWINGIELQVLLYVALFLVIITGWIYFLFLVATQNSKSFDGKMVWVIAIFSFFFFAAPLFIISQRHQKQDLQCNKR